MPSIRQALSRAQGENRINELLDGSVGVVDLCGFSRDVVCLTKGSVRDLESSIRRNRGETADNIDAYVASRKKICKMSNRCIKNLKSCKQISTPLQDKDNDLKAIRTVLKGTEPIDFSVLKSALILLSGERGRSNQRSWSLLSSSLKPAVYTEENDAEDLFSLNIHKSQKSMDSIAMKKVPKQLKASEMTIQELQEGLEALFRSLVKTRVSFLNVLSR